MAKATVQFGDGPQIDFNDKEAVGKAAKKFLGHNRTRVGGFAVDQLKSVIARVEKLQEEKAGIAGDIRDVLAEARAHGFDVKAIRQILKIRKLEPQEREERETVLDTYLHALGMLAEQPDMFDGGEAAA